MTAVKKQSRTRANVIRQLFERNISNSQRVISGEFEGVLEDIILQMEDGSRTALPLPERTQRIAAVMHDGFAGLPPNGFEFSQWLWDVAPLHEVRIAHANNLDSESGFRYGIIHLRSVASRLLHLYATEQPQRVTSIEEMLDSAIGWIDARNHVRFALLEHFTTQFASTADHLRRVAREGTRWRCFLPLGVAAQLLVENTAPTARVLPLLGALLERVEDDHVRQGVRYLLRIGGMYGDAAALRRYLEGYDGHLPVRVQELISEFLGNPRWSGREEGEGETQGS